MKKILLGLILISISVGLGGCSFVSDLFSDDEIADVPQTEDKAIEYRIHPSDDTISLGSQWEDKGVTFTVGSVSETLYSNDDIDPFTIGIQKISYIFEYDNEVYEVVRKVYVIDDYLPEMELNKGIDTILVGDTWNDAGINVNSEIVSRDDIKTEGTVNINQIGTYTIQYIYENAIGNKVIVERIVSVVD